MRTSPRPRSQPQRTVRERGAAAVELAIVFPLLFLMLGAIVDFGRFFFLQVQVANAAREGARAAIVASITDADVKARAAAALPAVAPTDLTYPTLTLCGGVASNATVEVRAPFEWILMKPAMMMFGGSWGLANASSTAVMKCI